MLLVLDVQRDPWTPVPFNLPLDAIAIAVNLVRRFGGRFGRDGSGVSGMPEVRRVS